MVITHIQELLAQKFSTEESFTDCFVVEIKKLPPNRLEVFVDSDTALTIEMCRQISRYLEQHIDENQWMGEVYSIEVSSPGITRPLQFVRQYKKNVGRTLEVVTKDKAKKKAKLIAADDDKIVLEEEVKVKEGKKNVKTIVNTEIPYDNIEKATVKISFN